MFNWKLAYVRYIICATPIGFAQNRKGLNSLARIHILHLKVNAAVSLSGRGQHRIRSSYRANKSPGVESAAFNVKRGAYRIRGLIYFRNKRLESAPPPATALQHSRRVTVAYIIRGDATKVTLSFYGGFGHCGPF